MLILEVKIGECVLQMLPTPESLRTSYIVSAAEEGSNGTTNWLHSAQIKPEQQAVDAGGILLKFNHVFTFRISPSSRVKCRISALGLVKDQTSPYLLELSSRKCT